MNQEETTNSALIATHLPKNFKKKDKINKSLLIRNYIANLNNPTKMKFWIKTLLSSLNALPQIMNTLDKIIELQASSVSFASNIYNSDKSTLKDIEKVIDLSDRKNTILNIYLMTKDMLKGLSENDMILIEKRYVDGWSIDEISKEFEISHRTVFRKIDKIIENIHENCLKKHWSVKFIESQIQTEGWLKEKFTKLVSDYCKNINYKQESETTCLAIFDKTSYSKSSSELYEGNLG